MGSSTSYERRIGGGSAGSVDSRSDLVLKDYNLSTPNAAVIGAGIAGVHVAYELAHHGFAVTVYEQQPDAAMGETATTLPFVGVGLLEPSLLRMSLQRQLTESLLSPRTFPDLIVRDHWFNSLCSPVLQRWVWGRTKSVFTEKEVMWYTNNLSCLSVAVIGNLTRRYPALLECVSDTAVDVFTVDPARAPDDRTEAAAGEQVAESRLVLAATAHKAPVMMRPVEWTRTLAGICARELGVRFAYNTRVEVANHYLKYDVETTRTLRVSTEDPSNPGERLYREEQFDVVVLAAGANTGIITTGTTRLPIVGLRGWGATLADPTGPLRTALESVFPPSSLTTQRLLCLRSACSLFAYNSNPRWTIATSGEAPVAATGSCALDPDQQPELEPRAALGSRDGPPPQYCIAGLMSVDITEKTPDKRNTVVQADAVKQRSRLESYISAKCGLEVPLTDSQTPVSVQSYVRAFTPDGVPIIDHNGAAFNTFVCSGFGDHAADFAPGAATILGRLVRLQAEQLLEEDRAQLISKGYLVSDMPQSQVQKVERDLEKLYSGALPEADIATSSTRGGRSSWRLWKLLGCAPCGTKTTPRGEVSKAVDSSNDRSTSRTEGLDSRVPPGPMDTEAVQLMEHLRNPFSTNRFTGLVKKDCRDVTHRSIINRFYTWETSMTRAAEPYERRFNQYMVALAKNEDVPAFVQRILLRLFDEHGGQTPPLVSPSQVDSDTIKRVIAQHETGDGSGVSVIERSRIAQKGIDQRARELFSGDGIPTDASTKMAS